MPTEAAEIKAMLQANVEALARSLAPDGRRNGNYWIGKNPTRPDANGGSFWVSINRYPGAWKDEATGDTGDVLQLIGYCEGLSSFPEILKWARGWLGIDGVPMPQRQARVAEAQAAIAGRGERSSEDLERERKAAFAMYVRARKAPFVGSPADLYLRSRGIDVRELGRMPGVLGWLDHWQRPNGTWTDVCMLAGLQDEAGRTIAVHRTFLVEGPDGWQKKPGEARKIWPSYGGAAIRLWRGGSKLSIEQAAKNGLRETLVLVEGVEDGLSVALAKPELRVWCAASLPNLALQVLPECCDEVIVCADNDWGKRQAQKQFDAAIARLCAQGRKVSIARSMIGKDMNDALRGQA